MLGVEQVKGVAGFVDKGPEEGRRHRVQRLVAGGRGNDGVVAERCIGEADCALARHRVVVEHNPEQAVCEHVWRLQAGSCRPIDQLLCGQSACTVGILPAPSEARIVHVQRRDECVQVVVHAATRLPPLGVGGERAMRQHGFTPSGRADGIQPRPSLNHEPAEHGVLWCDTCDPDPADLAGQVVAGPGSLH